MESRLKKIIFGIVYDFESRSEENWYQDIEIISKSGINSVTLNFSGWGMIELQEGKYDFSLLDKFISMLEENNIYVILSTGTSSLPVWIAEKYPDISPVDRAGNRYISGTSGNFCPNSPDYMRLSGKFVNSLAEKYGSRNNMIAWHVNKIPGNPLHECYCKDCSSGFSEWLKKRYTDIHFLNEAWKSEEFSFVYTHFNQISAPSRSAGSHNPVHISDYRLFMNDSYLRLFRSEKKIISKFSNLPVTTGFSPDAPVFDYMTWKEHLDYISLSSSADDCDETERIMHFDMARCISRESVFALLPEMHELFSVRLNKFSSPENLRFQCYEALAHGADILIPLYWNRPVSGFRKFRNAVLDSTGKPDLKYFHDVELLGQELKRFSSVSGSKVSSQVAIIIDLEMMADSDSAIIPSAGIEYKDVISRYHQVFFNLNVSVDFISMNSDFSGYSIVIAPMLFRINQTFTDSAEKYVNGGGTFITSFLSGTCDLNGKIISGNFPGGLSGLLGISVEKFGTTEDDVYSISFKGESKQYRCSKWAEKINPLDSKILAVYNSGILEKSPAVTINKPGTGRAVYISTWTSPEFLTKIMELELDLKEVSPVLQTVKDVKTVKRVRSNGKEFIFLLNYGSKAQKISFGFDKYKDMITGEIVSREVKIEPYDVLVIGDV